MPNLAEGLLKALIPSAPPGGQEIPVNPADVALAVGARTWIDSINTNDPYSPNQPMIPFMPEGTLPRTKDYQFGVNLYFAPRQEEAGNASFQQLLMLGRYDIVRLCIETRKQQILKIPQQWRVERQQGEKNADWAKRNHKDERIQYLNEFFRFPDHEHSLLDWDNMLLEEIFVTDALSIWPVMDADNKVLSLRQISGSTIKPLHTPQGWVPRPPNPAYQQILKGGPGIDLTCGLCEECATRGYHSNKPDQSLLNTLAGPVSFKTGRCTPLLYKPFNPSVDRFYGLPGTEQILRTILLAMNRLVSQSALYTQGNIPEALCFLPESWGKEQIQQFQAFFDEVSGNISIKRRVRFLPEAKQFIQTKEAIIKDELDDWLARVCCYAYSVAPTPLVKAVNRASAATMAGAAMDEGTLPTLGRISETKTQLVRQYFGKDFADIEHTYKTDNQSDPAQQANISDKNLKNGTWCINDVLDDQGRDPVQGGEVHRLYTPQGWVPLTSVDDLAQANLDQAKHKSAQPSMNGQLPASSNGNSRQKQIAEGGNDPSEKALQRMLKLLPEPVKKNYPSVRY